MNWDVLYLPEADKDIDNLSRQQQLLVKKAINKVQINPLPRVKEAMESPLVISVGLILPIS